MKILKTYLRSRLTDENVQRLSMTHIHKAIPINIDEVTSHFALKNRRLQLRWLMTKVRWTQVNGVAAVYQCITVCNSLTFISIMI